MNPRRWLFSAIATSLAIPMVTFAQNRAADGGLVPCGDVGEAPCQVCHFVDLANYTTNWLVGILSIAAAIMFLIAGYRLVTAGGNPSVMKSAKDMIVNVAIGFMIVLAAWLFIDFVMKSLLGGEGETAIGPWNGMECVDQPVNRTDSGSVGPVGSAADLTAAGITADPSLAPEAYSAGDCSVSNLISHGFTPQQAQVMSCLAQPESGCDNNADASNNGLNSSARGVFQIVYGWDDDCHSLRIPECTAANGGVPLDCGASDDTPGSACNRAASNFACNAAAARCLLNGEAARVPAGYQHWLADHRASTQASCVARYAG